MSVGFLTVGGCSPHDRNPTRIGGRVPQIDAGQTDSGADPNAKLVTWCEALTVLRTKCHRCHQEPPQSGAPFALLTYADTQHENSRKVPRWKNMESAVRADIMPATFLDELVPPVEPLTAE